MTASTMQKLATALLNEGYIVKKIEEEMTSFHEKYTGRIIVTIRPVEEEEEAEAKVIQLREEKEREEIPL